MMYGIMRRTSDSSLTRSPSERRKSGMTEENRTEARVVKARVAIRGDGIDDLLPEERALAAGLGAHRRAEFRAGRLAARAALSLLGFGGVPIGRDDDGAPVALGLDVMVSISHGRRY